jgi:flavin-dependent dehydrogenase
VDARDSDGSTRRWRSRFLVDASVRDAFLANRFNLKVKNPHHESAALFAHFDNVDRRSADEAGNISVYWFEHGWFWIIPLRDGRMSVGAVCRPAYLKSRKVPVKDFFLRTITLCPPLAERMRKASVATEIMTTGNFSYYSKRMFGRNYLLIGDAYAFIDPVFSTGVFLAMSGARSAADTIDRYLGSPRLGRPLLWLHRRRVLRWLRTYSWFIYRFTSPAMKRLFMKPSNRFGLKSAVISVLSGDHTPSIGLSLRIAGFKVLYYAFDTLAWRQSQQWRREVQVVA